MFTLVVMIILVLYQGWTWRGVLDKFWFIGWQRRKHSLMLLEFCFNITFSTLPHAAIICSLWETQVIVGDPWWTTCIWRRSVCQIRRRGGNEASLLRFYTFLKKRENVTIQFLVLTTFSFVEFHCFNSTFQAGKMKWRSLSLETFKWTLIKNNWK